MNKQKSIIYIYAAVFLILTACVSAWFSSGSVYADSEELITSVEALKQALKQAEDGAILRVSDIDFGYDTDPIELTRSVTIIGGSDEHDFGATLSNGSFIINGEEHIDPILIRLENLSFDSNALDNTTSQGLRSVRSALSFTGEVEASVINCSFLGYASQYGGAIKADYSGAADIYYSLSLAISGSSFMRNEAREGGAIYLGGNNTNISLRLEDSVFRENGAASGGAVKLSDIDGTVSGCEFTGQKYLAFSDVNDIAGGAACVTAGDVIFRNCLVTENTGWNGGGIALLSTHSELSDCILSRNTALNAGGAMMILTTRSKTISVSNCTFCENTSACENVCYVCRDYTHDEKVSDVVFTFVTFLKNTVTATDPVPLLSQPSTNIRCSVLADTECETDLPAKGNKYCLTCSPDDDELNRILTEKGSDSHLMLMVEGEKNREYVVPAEAVSSYLGNSNLIGTFVCGDNCFDTVRFALIGAGKTTSATYTNGSEFTFPEAARPLRTLSFWRDDTGRTISSEDLVVGGAENDLELTAEWELSPIGFLVLIIVPAAALTLFLLIRLIRSVRRNRRKKKLNAVLPDVSAEDDELPENVSGEAAASDAGSITEISSAADEETAPSQAEAIHAEAEEAAQAITEPESVSAPAPVTETVLPAEPEGSSEELTAEEAQAETAAEVSISDMISDIESRFETLRSEVSDITEDLLSEETASDEDEENVPEISDTELSEAEPEIEDLFASMGEDFSEAETDIAFEPVSEDVSEPEIDIISDLPTAEETEDILEPEASDLVEPAVEETAETEADDVFEPAVEETAEPEADDVFESAVEENAETEADDVFEPAIEEVSEPEYDELSDVSADEDIKNVFEAETEAAVTEEFTESFEDDLDDDLDFDFSEYLITENDLEDKSDDILDITPVISDLPEADEATEITDISDLPEAEEATEVTDISDLPEADDDPEISFNASELLTMISYSAMNVFNSNNTPPAEESSPVFSAGDILASIMEGLGEDVPPAEETKPADTVRAVSSEPESIELEASEPEFSEPETIEPEASEPETSEPEFSEPEASEPEASEPEFIEPETFEPEFTEPENIEPEFTEPETSEPETLELETFEPETSEPEVTEPENIELETSEPEAIEPEVIEPDNDLQEIASGTAPSEKELLKAIFEDTESESDVLSEGYIIPEEMFEVLYTGEEDEADEHEAAESVSADAAELAEAAASEPEFTEPEFIEPDAITEPEFTESDVTELEFTEPEASEPDAITEPEFTEPEFTEPEFTEPEFIEPDAIIEPETFTEPDAFTEPEASEPEAAEAASAESEDTGSLFIVPEVPVPEEVSPEAGIEFADETPVDTAPAETVPADYVFILPDTAASDASVPEAFTAEDEETDEPSPVVSGYFTEFYPEPSTPEAADLVISDPEESMSVTVRSEIEETMIDNAENEVSETDITEALSFISDRTEAPAAAITEEKAAVSAVTAPELLSEKNVSPKKSGKTFSLFRRTKKTSGGSAFTNADEPDERPFFSPYDEPEEVPTTFDNVPEDDEAEAPTESYFYAGTENFMEAAPSDADEPAENDAPAVPEVTEYLPKEADELEKTAEAYSAEEAEESVIPVSEPKPIVEIPSEPEVPEIEARTTAVHSGEWTENTFRSRKDPEPEERKSSERQRTGWKKAEKSHRTPASNRKEVILAARKEREAKAAAAKKAASEAKKAGKQGSEDREKGKQSTHTSERPEKAPEFTETRPSGAVEHEAFPETPMRQRPWPSYKIDPKDWEDDDTPAPMTNYTQPTADYSDESSSSPAFREYEAEDLESMDHYRTLRSAHQEASDSAHTLVGEFAAIEDIPFDELMNRKEEED